MQNFERMGCWIAAKELFVEAYEVTKEFPACERDGFVSQMRGAARSIAANIAEGAGYTGEMDSARFYRTGFGSSSEFYSDLHLTRAVHLLSDSDFDRLEARLLPARKQLSVLIKKIETRNGR